MFLGLLKEENKERFIELCGYAADADGVFEEKEEATIYTYCREMNIPESLPKKDNTLEEVLDQLKYSTSYNEKKIIQRGDPAIRVRNNEKTDGQTNNADSGVLHSSRCRSYKTRLVYCRAGRCSETPVAAFYRVLHCVRSE